MNESQTNESAIQFRFADESGTNEKWPFCESVRIKFLMSEEVIQYVALLSQ